MGLFIPLSSPLFQPLKKICIWLLNEPELSFVASGPDRSRALLVAADWGEHTSHHAHPPPLTPLLSEG